MKIILLGQKEIASVVGLSLVANALAEHELRIYLSPAATPGHSGVAQLDELEVYESALCDELASNPRAGALGLHGLDALAQRTNAPIGSLAAPNSDEGLETLRALAPDLLVSVRYRKILKEEAIAIPKSGVINLHSGVLPAYRGAMATFWAMLNGDDTIGATLHYIADGTIDTGPVIGIARRPLDYARSYLANILDLYPDGCAMIADAVANIAATGQASSSAQPAGGHYYSFPAPADFERFKALNHGLYGTRELDDFLDRFKTAR